MKDFPVKGVVVGVTRDGAGASRNILAGILEGRWTTHLGKGAGLSLALEEASTDAGASLLTGGICPERVSNLQSPIEVDKARVSPECAGRHVTIATPAAISDRALLSWGAKGLGAAEVILGKTLTALRAGLCPELFPDLTTQESNTDMKNTC